jgi:hypothetical protein
VSAERPAESGVRGRARRRHPALGALAVLGLVVLAWLVFDLAGTLTDDRDPRPAAPSAPLVDRSGATERLACGQYRDIIRDVPILTRPELRARLIHLDATARVADDRAVAKGARDMLIAATRQDPDAFKEAWLRTAGVCERWVR